MTTCCPSNLIVKLSLTVDDHVYDVMIVVLMYYELFVSYTNVGVYVYLTRVSN